MQTSLDRELLDPIILLLLTPRLPSWAWGYQGSSNWAVGLLGFVSNPPYAASGSSIPDISNIAASSPTSSFPSWRQLRLSGVKISTIASISRYPYFGTAGKYGLEALHKAYVCLFDPLNIAGKWAD